MIISKLWNFAQKQKYKFFFFIILHYLTTNALAASDFITYKGVTIGSSLEEYKAKLPDHDCNGSGNCIYFAIASCTKPSAQTDKSTDAVGACITRNSFGGVFVDSVQSSFINGNLAAIEITINSNFFDGLVDTLSLRFGKPKKTEVFEVKNKLGAVFLNKKIDWVADETVFSIEKYGGSINKSVGYLTSTNELFRKETERVNQKIKNSQDF